jgi:conjugative relaxase-like TrwC/TraI family protein
MNQNTSSAGAKAYFSTADYYSEGQELIGVWHGKGAARLGLSGQVNKDAWDALCDNRHPGTGLTLTSRQKAERRVGYDLSFHVPKSVSMLYGITEDARILDAFRASVNETMQEIESEMKTRVRKGGKNGDRITGNMVWCEFVHTTARPVNGIPDPHLHAHCFVFNTTFDANENRWKAGQFGDIKRDAGFFEARFHSRMARRMEELGLPVERTRTAWEIVGFSKSSLRKFSRRTALIEATAAEKGITDPSEKAELGARMRERKQKHLSTAELRREWISRLSDDERSGLLRVAVQVGAAPIAENSRAAKDAATLAIDHCFERNSVVPERQLLAEAMKRCVGQASVQTAEHAMRRERLIVDEWKNQRLATTPEVLAEEESMIRFAREGRGESRALGNGGHVFKRDWLNDGQRKAVSHVLSSRDHVILVRGAAGVGKTAMMQETVEAIEAGGKRVFTFAPSADASRGVLRQEGFKDAETVARLLMDEKLQQQVAGQVIWIDEAGLLGTRQMAQVFDLAEKIEARVVLSGDRRQHGSVARGAALRLLETEAGLATFEIKEIQRQKGAYKQTVQSLSEGHVEDAFRQLDRLGWVKEVVEADRYKLLARDYVASVAVGKSALVVSPTHLEGEWVTDEIRSELRRAGKLGQEQRQFRVLENANFTEAERRDGSNYANGDVIVFHQNAKGFRRGDRMVADDEPLPLDQAARFSVFHPGVLSLSPGDVVRVTRGGKTADGQHRLDNGAIVRVKEFSDSGDIKLANGWTISRNFGHLTHGYVVTSHASQGKTVDHVFIGQSAQSFPASSREQFYVSVSRGRTKATVYTDDKHSLLEAVRQSDDRLTATEFVAGREDPERGMAMESDTRLAEAQRDSAQRAQQREVNYER